MWRPQEILFFFFFFNLVLLWGSVFSAAVIGKSLLTVLGSVCRSAHLTEHHRMDFISVTSEPVRNTLAEAVPRVAAARAHTHSKAGLICGSARFHVNDRQDADAVHFIHHDKSLNHSKLSHRVLGVLKCLIVYALFIWISLTYCGKVYVKCWIYYAISLCSSD